MATHFLPSDHEDDDYIDMEVGSCSNFFFHVMSSPQHPKEFEFQMFSTTSKRETTTSPADELFYKGKLLPLHLPPRLRMVEKLLLNSNSYNRNTDTSNEAFSTPLENTPFESCNISPFESCESSGELDPKENLFRYPTEVNGLIGENPKKSWARKLKLIKHSSRAYFKSLFGKSGGSDKFAGVASRKLDEQEISKSKECVNNYTKVAKEPPGQIITGRFNNVKDYGNVVVGGGGHHRRSFSGAIKWLSASKSSSLISSNSSGSCSFSSSSASSSHGGGQKLQSLKRSSSSNPDIESSIQSAIAHCKSSQRKLHSRKAGSDMGFCSLSASRIIHEDQERLQICRG